jgi:quinohemoprotein ethanol dehydrogenase
MKLSAALLAGLTLLALTACGPQQPDNPAPLTAADVDGAAIAAADQHSGDWLSHGRTYSEQRFSPLTAINRQTVKQLGLAWYADLDTNRGMETTPIVVGGVMYVTSAWSVVYALDAKTGQRLWTFDPQVDKAKGVNACCDVVNRGVAVWKGKIYVGTIDGRLIALNAGDGAKVWEQVTVDQSRPYTITAAPRVVKDKVIIGNGGAELGVRGYITAYDAATGDQVWRFYTTPNPDKQPDGAASDSILAEKANATWDDAGAWRASGGGGTAWDAQAYDPELDLLYIGVGNGSPWNQRIRSPSGGDNLFISSILALRPDTGEYVWHYQTTPGETWDYTATQHIMLADLDIGGAKRKVLMQAPKNGFFYVLDRATGELLSADKYQPVNWATGVDLKTGRPVEVPEARFAASPFAAIPGPLGAHNWHPMAFSPDKGLVYIPAQTIPQIYVDEQPGAKPQVYWNTGVEFASPGPTPDAAARAAAKAALKGQLVAWDPVAKAPRWTVDYNSPWNGGLLATAGGLVFQGGLETKLRAYDAADGKTLWETETQYPVLAGPVTYEIGGEQYLAVAAGWGTAFPLLGESGLPKGASPELGRILVFKIGASAALPPYERSSQPQVAAAAPFGPPQLAELGRALYDRNCLVCHGGNAIGSGIIPDLRWSPTTASAEAFADVLLNGSRAARGMASFAGRLAPEEGEAIRAYLLMRASEDAPPAPPQ